MIRVDGRCGAKADETAQQRERRRRALVKALQRCGLPASLSTLDSGDVAFRGYGPNDTLPRIGVELKKVSDLLTSMQSGRLVEQVKRMVGTPEAPGAFNRSYVLVEGIMRADPGSGVLQVPVRRNGKTAWVDGGFGRRRVMYADVLSFFQSLRELAGVHVLRSSNDHDTVWQIVSLYTWWSKPWEKHKSLHVVDVARPVNGGIHLGALSDLARVAAALPLIGYERARAVERRFASIEEMINASTEDWKDVEGIGKGIATRVVEAIKARAPRGTARNPQAVRQHDDAPARHHGARRTEARSGAQGLRRAVGGDVRPRHRAGAADRRAAAGAR